MVVPLTTSTKYVSPMLLATSCRMVRSASVVSNVNALALFATRVSKSNPALIATVLPSEARNFFKVAVDVPVVTTGGVCACALAPTNTIFLNGVGKRNVSVEALVIVPIFSLAIYAVSTPYRPGFCRAKLVILIFSYRHGG